MRKGPFVPNARTNLEVAVSPKYRKLKNVDRGPVNKPKCPVLTLIFNLMLIIDQLTDAACPNGCDCGLGCHCCAHSSRKVAESHK